VLKLWYPPTRSTLTNQLPKDQLPNIALGQRNVNSNDQGIGMLELKFFQNIALGHIK